MAPTTFSRYLLRTTDVAAARAFYADALGLELDDGVSPNATSAIAVVPLHEQARARGAPAHWLGQLGVDDVEATARRLLELGSEPLGPTQRDRQNAAFAVFRDLVGAVVFVRDRAQPSTPAPVGWHHLHTQDLDRAWAIYAGLFGWTHTATHDLVDPVGGYRTFAWGPGGQSVGSMANTARSPGVHTHWLFFFAVADLERASAQVRARGGEVFIAPAELPGGTRLVGCHDPQGAAFGLHQAAPRG